MRSFIILFTFVFIITGWPSSTSAVEQSKIENIKSDWGVWPTFDLTFPLYKEKFSGYLMTLPITVNKSRDLNPLILRTGVIYNPTKKLSFGILFDRNGNFTKNANFNEYRITEQVSYKHTFKYLDRLSISARLRIKERMFEGLGTLIQPTLTLRTTFALGKNKKWYLAASNEFLWNLNKIPGREVGFAENRPFLGVGRKITPSISFEMGWQPSLINSVQGKDDIFRSYIASYLSIRIPYQAAKLRQKVTLPIQTNASIKPLNENLETLESNSGTVTGANNNVETEKESEVETNQEEEDFYQNDTSEAFGQN